MTCSHGMPSPASCIDCMDEGPVAPPATWKRVGEPFRARLVGPCHRHGCHDLIEPGQMVQRWDRGDERTVYNHAHHPGA